MSSHNSTSNQPILPPNNSLVRYNNPILVSTINNYSSSTALNKNHYTNNNNNKFQEEEKTQINSLTSHSTATEDILNSILPPREWQTSDGQLWVQFVSSTPATKSEIILLQEQLDNKLQLKQARETGICPIRQELYAQCFDELIRQVTIHCAERGLLLLRIRDELRLTLSSYETLYESSIAFGMRKALSTEQEKIEKTTKIHAWEKDKKDLEKEVKDWRIKIENLEKKEKERKEEEFKKHREEIEQLKKHNIQLKKELEQMLSLPTNE